MPGGDEVGQGEDKAGVRREVGGLASPPPEGETGNRPVESGISSCRVRETTEPVDAGEVCPEGEGIEVV